VGSEYFINSQELEDKVRNLLPSQGGAGAGFDLSASTQIIPIIDLTESAEGSNVRQDLQTALSFNSGTSFSVSNATSTIISNTGYYRVFGDFGASASNTTLFQLTDGVSTKNFLVFRAGTGNRVQREYDFIVFIPAGQSLVCISNSASGTADGMTRQIADIDGNLVNP
jgi:hypothetical protein